ncbi:myb/SANT-like DNA-binding domain-containing protein 3 [Ornithodoros turicata]|uniref:myb/SANT-like DNA-binding domain-containing protein 3 n=1 Tax=Ornithodoros turicata TaxID=34597 RepID=UPI0031398C32
MSKRTPYMTPDETDTFLELLRNYKGIVENKKTDSVSAKSKQQAWEKMAAEFNSIPGVVHRNVKQLRKVWDNLKGKWKKETAKGVRHSMLTGGGGPPSPMDPVLEQVESIVPHIATRIHNPFDGDRKYGVFYFLCTFHTVPGSTGGAQLQSERSTSDDTILDEATTAGGEGTQFLSSGPASHDASSHAISSSVHLSELESRRETMAQDNIRRDAEHTLRVKLMNEEHKLKLRHMRIMHKLQVQCVREEIQVHKMKQRLLGEQLTQDMNKQTRVNVT